jgi:hypothetical protein
MSGLFLDLQRGGENQRQMTQKWQDVCSSDCERISVFDRNTLTEDKDEIKDYWLRLEPEGLEEPQEQRVLRLEGLDAPCKVGFAVDKDNSCPLFGLKTTVENFPELLDIVKMVAAFRNAQAKEVREIERTKAMNRSKS